MMLCERNREPRLSTLGPSDNAHKGPFPDGVFRSSTIVEEKHLSQGSVSYYLDGESLPMAAVDGGLIPFPPHNKGALAPCDGPFLEPMFTQIGNPPFLPPQS